MHYSHRRQEFKVLSKKIKKFRDVAQVLKLYSASVGPNTYIGNDVGSAGGAVASNTSGQQFESHQSH